MAPPVETWPVSELPLRIQADVFGRKRKPAEGQRGDVDLAKCELLEMVQYECVVEGGTEAKRHRRDARVMCRPVERWFRRCQDKKGSFVVETTAWERPSPK